MWNDKEFVLAMVNVNGKALQYATSVIRGDQEVVFTAFQQMGFTVKGQTSVKDLVLTAVKTDGKALQYVSDE